VTTLRWIPLGVPLITPAYLYMILLVHQVAHRVTKSGCHLGGNTLALSTETEGDEGSDNGDGGTTSHLSMGKIDLEFHQHTLNQTVHCGWSISR